MNIIDFFNENANNSEESVLLFSFYISLSTVYYSIIKSCRVNQERQGAAERDGRTWGTCLCSGPRVRAAGFLGKGSIGQFKAKVVGFW